MIGEIFYFISGASIVASHLFKYRNKEKVSDYLSFFSSICFLIGASYYLVEIFLN